MEQDISVSLERHNLSSKPSNYVNIILTWSILILIGLIVFVLAMLVKFAFFTKTVPRSISERTYYYYLNEVKKHPEMGSSWVELGKAELDLGRFDQASEHFKKALKVNPKIAWAHYYLAACYGADGDLATQIKELQAEVSNRPNNHFAYFDLGEVYFGQGRYKEAIQAYQKVIECSPASADAHLALAQAYEQDKQVEQAIAEYNEVLRYIPDHREARDALRRLTGQ